jgi:hypothetical protein
MLDVLGRIKDTIALEPDWNMLTPLNLEDR